MKNIVIGIVLVGILFYQIIHIHTTVETMPKTKRKRKNIYGKSLKRCRKRNTRLSQ